MLARDSFSVSSTSVQLSCPEDTTGLERIMLAAQGDLQRLLSAFFARTISIDRIYANTSPRVEPASVEHPITQERRVHLICASRIVCVATSAVTITSPECERLFLDEKFAIGQLFRQLRRAPKFSLLNVETQFVDGRRELQRTYRLETEGITCEILEVFPDRDMFVKGEAWLQDGNAEIVDKPAVLPVQTIGLPSEPAASPENLFAFTPHSLASTPTLSSILERQARDPIIGKKIFAAFPRSSESPSPSHQSPYIEITYAQFARLIEYEASVWYDRLSPLLSAKDEPEADAPVVALLSDSGFHFAVTLMALLRLNVTVFPLAPSNSEPAIVHLLATCHVSILVHGEGYTTISQRAAAKSSVHSVALDSALKNHDYSSFSVPSLGDKRPCILHARSPSIPVIVHSSGSTAFPKPVRWSNTSFLSNSQVLLTSGGWSAFTQPDNRFLCLGPLFHTMGLTIGLAGTICAGTTIIFPLTRAWPPSPADIARSFHAAEASTCIIVPLLLEQLVNVLEADVTPSRESSLNPLIKLQLLLVGGAHCPDKLATHLVSRGVNLKYIYGSSETGHLMVGSHSRPSATGSPSWNLLRPFPHTSVILKPLSDKVAPHGEKIYQVHMAPDDVRLAVGVLKSGDETWNTGDVVQEVPPDSGWFKLLYRDDDILVHVSGEKTNPVPMETSCRSSKLIDRIAIVGHQRRVTAAIVQLDETEARQYSEEECLAVVREAIKRANSAAPSHSHVMEEMILVLPLASQKQIPRTPKGNCIRPKVLQTFAEEIDTLYRDFEGDGDSSNGSSTSSLVTLADVEEEVTKIFEQVIEKPLIPLDVTKSLFDFGLNSVTAIQLRNRLSKAFGTNLHPQFVYENFSLALLSRAVHDCVASREMTPMTPTSRVEIWPTRGEILDELLKRHLFPLRASANHLLASRSELQIANVPEGHVVAVVGAAGSLGIWQVKTLLDRPDVLKVVCLIRGTNIASIYDKLSNGFKKAALNDLDVQASRWRENQLSNLGVPAVELDQRLVVVPFDLANPRFERGDYLALASTLTTIIHTGWKMDFNQVVQSFEQDCLVGTTQLLLLAGFRRPKRFYFISSIGVVMESKQNPVPEKVLPWTKGQHITASPHGYSESKFICEYLVEAASTALEIPCSIARIGQITGDTIAGVWKTQEMNPIIIAGSARIGKFPVISDAILDWTPVDTVGHATVELALGQQAPGSVSVHHIVNRTPSTYADMARDLLAAGIAVFPTSPEEWWNAIKADEGNPCLAVEAYIEEAFVNAQVDLAKGGGKALRLDISQTLKLAPTSLALCPPLDGALWKKYVHYWRQIGFIGK